MQNCCISSGDKRSPFSAKNKRHIWSQIIWLTLRILVACFLTQVTRKWHVSLHKSRENVLLTINMIPEWESMDQWLEISSVFVGNLFFCAIKLSFCSVLETFYSLAPFRHLPNAQSKGMPNQKEVGKHTLSLTPTTLFTWKRGTAQEKMMNEILTKKLLLSKIEAISKIPWGRERNQPWRKSKLYCRIKSE